MRRRDRFTNLRALWDEPSDFRFVRVHDRHLSLWQSAVAENVRTQLGAGATTRDVLAHPMMRAADAHVTAAVAAGPGPDAVLGAPAPDDPQLRNEYLSRLGLRWAWRWSNATPSARPSSMSSFATTPMTTPAS